MAKETVEVYVLDVRIPKKDPNRINIKQEMSLGSDSTCDIRIQDFGLAPLQGRFRLQNDVLTLTNLGPENSLKVGSQKCGHGRMYILDKGDKCIIDKVKIIIRKDKVEREIEGSADLNDLEDNAGTIEGGMEEETHAGTISEDEQVTQDSIASNSSLKKVETDDGKEEYEIVEEIVYIDEDGNEVTGAKEKTFISNFRDLINKKEKSRKKISKGYGAPNLAKGKMKKIKAPAAGPLARLIGVFYNIIIFLALFNFALPIIKEEAGLDANKYGDQVFKMAKPYLSEIPTELPQKLIFIPEVKTYYDIFRTEVTSPVNFKYLLFFLAYEVLFQLILGIGLGQFLVGLKNDGSLLLSRLLAPVRAIFSILLWPFLIFDLPVIFRKRSFKEMTTFTLYQTRSATLTALLSLVILPLLTIAAVNYKIYPAFLKGTPPIAMNVEKYPTNKASFKDKEVPIQSIALNIKAKAYINTKNLYIPTIHVDKNIKKPKLIVADLYKAKTTEILLWENILSITEIKNFLTKDPFLSYTFPDLYGSINDKSGKLLVDNRQLMEVLFHIVGLDVKEPFRVVKSLGIVLSPYYELQTLLLNKLSTKTITLVNLVQGSKESMVVMGNNSANANRFILRAGSESLSILEFNFGNKNTSFNESLMRKIFYHSTTFNGQYSKVINNAAKSSDPYVRSMASLDIFNNIINGKKINNAESKIISDLYVFLSAQGIKTESNEFQQLLLDNFEELDKTLLKLKSKNKDEKLGDLRLSLNRIQQALYKRDQTFFNLNK